MRILLGCRKLIGIAVFACVAVFILSLFGSNQSGKDSLPTLAVLPSLTWTPEAVAVQVSDTPGVTIIPTEIRAASGFVTITPAPGTTYPTATITDTALPTITPSLPPDSAQVRAAIGGTLAVSLSNTYKQIYGVQDVQMSVIPAADGSSAIVGGNATIIPGVDAITVVTAMRDFSYKILNVADVDFDIILDNGIQAIDYRWDNSADTWVTTTLSSSVTASIVQGIDANNSASNDAGTMEIQPVTYYAEKQVNVRSCPRTSCDRLGQVTPRTALTVDAFVNGDEVEVGNLVWYRVQYGAQKGFVYSGLMLLTLPQSPTAIVVQPPQPPPPQIPQQSATQLPSSGYNGPIPKNCTEARDMGIDQYTAAVINPRLDRDGDGKACYDDQ